eukprot:GDKK01039132.1.p1 GENE.GDKK01039132.1~~GDKK01039132.1.p1  ORF type:complete len:328 (+),score=26.81 GDKK01039132.1:112-984(+)
MGNGWYYPADTWSLGCILYEVYTGHKLFDVSDDCIHLAQMHTRLGALPKHFTHESQNSRKFFDSMGQLTRGNLRAAPYIRAVTEELRDDATFCDLILSMLAYEPTRRIRCDDALRHPFVTGEQTLRKSPSPMTEVPANIPLRQVAREIPMPTSAQYPSTSALDKENAVRSAAVPPLSKQPLYNNIRLAGISAVPSVNAPLTARSSSSSTNPYYATPTTHAAAPLTSRSYQPLISPAQSVAATATHQRLVPTSSASSLLDDRYNALKRTKSDPSQMPVAGRASGIQYNRIW